MRPRLSPTPVVPARGAGRNRSNARGERIGRRPVKHGRRRASGAKVPPATKGADLRAESALAPPRSRFPGAPSGNGGRHETPRASAVRARRSPGAHSASPRPATATIPPRGRAPHGLTGRHQRRVRNAAPAAGLEIGAQRISLGAFAYVAHARFACFSRPIG